MATACNGLEPLGIISHAPKSERRSAPQTKKRSLIKFPPCVWYPGCPSSKRTACCGQKKEIRKMGSRLHVSKINCTTSKYLTNYYAYTHTHTGIPNGQLDGHIPGNDAARGQRCARRERWCRPERRTWRSGKSGGMSNKWPGLSSDLVPRPNQFPSRR